MDLLGDILSSMDKNKRPGLSKPDKMIQKHNEEIRKTAEKERMMINNYKLKIQNKVADFLKNDKVSTMQFPPMEKIFRSVILEACDEAANGLICHTFGREERYVIVYKNPPNDLELEARRFFDYKQWNKEIEAEFKKKKEEQILLATECSTSSQEVQETSKGNNKKTKLIHLECEAISSNPNRTFGMVSSDLKKDKRTVEETLNDLQQKKRLKTQQTNPN
ncbi:sperm-associated antigen 7 homolog [Chironomus tepperi]|uniref:sperm-associated antigen 7 homolog n=1 Tax=Chironomus tepperi TaxID=113505 RepID=UPI00391F1C01